MIWFLVRGVFAVAVCAALTLVLVDYARHHPPDVIDHTTTTTSDRLKG